jgi:hypothetical protein
MASDHEDIHEYHARVRAGHEAELTAALRALVALMDAQAEELAAAEIAFKTELEEARAVLARIDGEA